MDCVASQAPMSMRYPGQEHWSEFPFPSPGDFLNPEIELASPASYTDALSLSHQGSPGQIKGFEIYSKCDGKPLGFEAETWHDIW